MGFRLLVPWMHLKLPGAWKCSQHTTLQFWAYTSIGWKMPQSSTVPREVLRARARHGVYGVLNKELPRQWGGPAGRQFSLLTVFLFGWGDSFCSGALTVASRSFILRKTTWANSTGLMLLLLSRFSRVRLCARRQPTKAPQSLGFSRQEHWGGVLLPSPMHASEKWQWSRSVVSHS